MKRALFVALMLLQWGDALSTQAAIAHGAVELNPLVRELGLWPAKLIVIVLLIALAPRCRVRTFVILCSYYALVVASNLWIANR